MSSYNMFSEPSEYQAYNEGYQQGRADREKELSELPNEYSEKLWKNAYQKGKADEQLRSIESAKEQAKEYRVALEKAKTDEVRKFAEWLLKHPLLNGFDEEYFYTIRDCQMTVDEVLAEWKEGNND